MVNNLKVAALAGVLALVAAPAFAQQGVPVAGDLPIVNQLPLVGNNSNGLDFDPFHIFSPAPEAAPAAAPMMMHHHHMMMHHHHMMMHHKKMMMHHKMMKKAM